MLLVVGSVWGTEYNNQKIRELLQENCGRQGGMVGGFGVGGERGQAPHSSSSLTAQPQAGNSCVPLLESHCSAGCPIFSLLGVCKCSMSWWGASVVSFLLLLIQRYFASLNGSLKHAYTCEQSLY